MGLWNCCRKRVKFTLYSEKCYHVEFENLSNFKEFSMLLIITLGYGTGKMPLNEILSKKDLLEGHYSLYKSCVMALPENVKETLPSSHYYDFISELNKILKEFTDDRLTVVHVNSNDYSEDRIALYNEKDFDGLLNILIKELTSIKEPETKAPESTKKLGISLSIYLDKSGDRLLQIVAEGADVFKQIHYYILHVFYKLKDKDYMTGKRDRISLVIADLNKSYKNIETILAVDPMHFGIDYALKTFRPFIKEYSSCLNTGLINITDGEVRALVMDIDTDFTPVVFLHMDFVADAIASVMKFKTYNDNKSKKIVTPIYRWPILSCPNKQSEYHVPGNPLTTNGRYR